MSDDEQFKQAFEVHTGISIRRKDQISSIKDNHSDVKDFKLYSPDADCFTDLSWRLLGRYIAKNNHLNKIELDCCGITDEKMAFLFRELTCSTSLSSFSLVGNSFGIEGLRSMVPFLTDNLSLLNLNLSNNNSLTTECFELLIQTLHERSLKGRSLESLFMYRCNITNISALDTYTLLNIQQLILDSNNNIGREGCTTLANILENERSSLSYLSLEDTGMGDEEAELLATSLENNTKMQKLELSNIAERGCKAFLKLLVDASSIESTYNSNHALKCLPLYSSGQGVSVRTTELVESAIQINKSNNSPHSAGRMKVIKYQLNSKNRNEICELQGSEYSSIGNLFADIEPALLPKVLSLIGREHGHNEFYTALIPMAPTLMSCIDTSGMMKDLMVKNKARDNDIAAQIAALTLQRAALTAKNDQLSRRLTERESSDRRQKSTIDEDIRETVAESGMKRQRSED